MEFLFENNNKFSKEIITKFITAEFYDKMLQQHGDFKFTEVDLIESDKLKSTWGFNTDYSISKEILYKHTVSKTYVTVRYGEVGHHEIEVEYTVQLPFKFLELHVQIQENKNVYFKSSNFRGTGDYLGCVTFKKVELEDIINTFSEKVNEEYSNIIKYRGLEYRGTANSFYYKVKDKKAKEYLLYIIKESYISEHREVPTDEEILKKYFFIENGEEIFGFWSGYAKVTRRVHYRLNYNYTKYKLERIDD